MRRIASLKTGGSEHLGSNEMNCINKTGGSEPLGSNETNCITKTGGREPLGSNEMNCINKTGFISLLPRCSLPAMR